MSQPENAWPTVALMTVITVLMAVTFHMCARPDTVGAEMVERRECC